jgi:hypothetical protein
MNENAVPQEQSGVMTPYEQGIVDTNAGTPMGFEDEEQGDLMIPRVQVVQMLSQARKDKEANEGDIINSLTKDKYNDKTFIPVFKFNNNIWWRDLTDGGGMLCLSRDGKHGQTQDGQEALCAACKRCEFDNTKTGRDAYPVCTKYFNFFGFFEGERMPIILSFAKTNYKEGKKLYSLAKVTMQNMWHHGYKLSSKIMAKGNNEWYIIAVQAAGATSAEDREFGMTLFKQFAGNLGSLSYDVEPQGSDDTAPKVDITNVEY